MIQAGAHIRTKARLLDSSPWRARGTRRADTAGRVTRIWGPLGEVDSCSDADRQYVVVVQHSHGTASYWPEELGTV